MVLGEIQAAGDTCNSDPDFAEKMAEVLCVYHEVRLLKKAAARLH
jgi:hypothetical protein